MTSGTINYASNQVTLIGSDFQPEKTTPAVFFDGAKLKVDSSTDTQIVATLPAATPAGTFRLTVTNCQGRSSAFDLTYGATGPQGSVGPAGARGTQGPAGQAGATGATGPQGPQGTAGAPGPQGATGPAGVTGPAGTQGPKGTAGAPGGALSFVVNTQPYIVTLPSDTHSAIINSIILPNAGTYVIGGEEGFINLDPKVLSNIACEFTSNWAGSIENELESFVTIPPGGASATLPFNGYYVVPAGEAPTTLNMVCFDGGTSNGAGGGQYSSDVRAIANGTLTAIQVQ